MLIWLIGMFPGHIGEMPLIRNMMLRSWSRGNPSNQDLAFCIMYAEASRSWPPCKVSKINQNGKQRQGRKRKKEKVKVEEEKRSATMPSSRPALIGVGDGFRPWRLYESSRTNHQQAPNWACRGAASCLRYVSLDGANKMEEPIDTYLGWVGMEPFEKVKCRVVCTPKIRRKMQNRARQVLGSECGLVGLLVSPNP